MPPFSLSLSIPVRLAATLCVAAIAACSSAPSGRAPDAQVGLRTKLDGSGPRLPPRGFPTFVDHSVGQEEVSMQAMGLVGVPYRWGGNSPAAGFDCSGLVRYVVARAADIILPRTTADMSKQGVSISPDEIAPGDLIFFDTDGRAHSHVGIYVGDYRFVNAPSTGGTVRIDYVTNPYWARHFDGIRRVAGLDRKAIPALDFPTPPTGPATIAPDRVFAGQATPAARPLGAPGDDPIAAAIARADSRAATAEIARQSNDDDPIARVAARGY